MRNPRRALLLTVVVLGLVACDAKENERAVRPATGERPSEAKRSTWVTEQDVRAWQEAEGKDGVWVAAYFLPAEWRCYETQREDLARRFRRISTRDKSLPPGELVRNALAAVEGAKPEALSNPLERVHLRLPSVRVDGETVYLDFDRGIYATNAMGTCGGEAMALQFLATVHHYFPDAAAACVLVKGIPSGHKGRGLVFHDSIACPLGLQE
jgi:hypothetical protein